MRRTRALAIMTGACLAVAVLAATPRTDTDPGITLVQQALEALRNGQFAQAEQYAASAAASPGRDFGRAWLIIAAARQRQGQLPAAQEAYRNFLKCCCSPELRLYAMEQLKACQSQSDAKPPLAPSKQLTKETLEQLARVDKDVRTESSEHFVVRARSAALAKLIAAQAEASLERICRDILGGQEYPNTVEIYVWKDGAEYKRHATDAPEWSGGAYSLSTAGGMVVRRIDLTQLDKAGRFAAIMIDRILPHELCHLVTREFFGDADCPLFLNEGLAMLAEPEVDSDRLVLAGTVLAGKGKMVLGELILQQRQDLSDAGPFYAESYSFLSYLRGRLSPSQFKDLLGHVKGGCSINDALHRALYMSGDQNLLDAMELAWEDHALEQAQYLRALSGQKDIALAR